MIRLETEIKYSVSKDDYIKMERYLGECDKFRMEKKEEQTNYYFDTDHRDYKRNGISIRIRIKDDSAEFSCKIPSNSTLIQKNISSKYEFLTEISIAEAYKSVENGLNTYLFDQIKDIIPIDTLKVQIKPIRCRGSLTTERIFFSVNSYDHPILLDKSNYLGTEDYEIEWEIRDTTKAQAFLIDIFEKLLIIPFQISHSKSSRFFFFLDKAGE